MDISLHIDAPFLNQVNPEAVKAALLTTLELYRAPSADLLKESDLNLTVTITDDGTIQQLNHQYLGIDAPTDVLSFENSYDPEFPDFDASLRHHLGDIIIAYPAAKAQALAAGHAPQEEIILLSVHGALHLLGFDHDTAQGKDKMWMAQFQVMDKLGLAHIQPTER